ncbi:M56 family metallopeptidase [Runella slithyformis]|uniref:Peptidase M56 BlaR1 n=1 Tax=Runella slithyformis (strain ATCC 29530 / DSM 19594 / LMG 11500 / NCIMB 11436 / LSU 4) TaxID=761193 RepID=A0A7U3ZMP1_RUNSL|nr:M56 family metallopeptidase [Runella slithyformis]AEI50037.1 peptidase M56 BlaR1 [Runella slithyformis DSM 19594]
MIIYLFKFAACSAFLLILYHWVLEKEKMPVFNRFYLLFSLLFSGLVPFVTFELSAETLPAVIEKTQTLSPVSSSGPLTSNTSISISAGTDTLPWTTYLWGLYGVLTLAFLIRFIRNLYSFWQLIRTHPVVEKGMMNLVLIPQNNTPYCFGKYVFVNRLAFERDEIEPEILQHEQAHIRQRHTLDVLFIELVLAFCWWNPTLWLYRRAIRLNHEFLADDWVIKTHRNPPAYQYLLLHTISQHSGVMLASSFNYLLTKKRFKMMNKFTSKKRAYALQTTALCVFSALVFVFSDISFAQTAPKVVPQSTTEADFAKEGVSQAMVEEYQQIVEKYIRKITKRGLTILEQPKEADRARLETIFKAMSKEQQSQQKYVMAPPLKPFGRITPTEEDFESYKDGKMFGVWVDEKKVPNTALNKYKASDFSHVFVSRLYKNAQATIGYKYKFQLDLMTNAYYEKYRSERLADKRYSLHFNIEKMMLNKKFE